MNSCNIHCMLFYLLYEKASFSNLYLSDNGEIRLNTLHTPEDEALASETKDIDADEAEGSDFAEEEDAGDVQTGDFWGGINDLGSMVSMGREEVSEDHKMWNDFASVQNSMGIEVEPVTIM